MRYSFPQIKPLFSPRGITTSNGLSIKSWLRFAFPILISILGIGNIFKELLVQGLDHHLYIDNLDSKLIYWIISWGFHILGEKGDILNFWNANSFYPSTSSLASSDSMLSIQLFVIPLRWMGMEMLPSIYLGLAMTILLSCILTIIALGRIGGFSGVEQAFIIFGSHFSLSVIGYFNHYQLFGFEIVIPYLLFLFLFFKDYKIQDLCFIVFIFVFGVCFSTYLGPMLVVLSLLASIAPILATLQNKNRLVDFFKHSFWKAAIIVLFSFSLLYIIQIKPYYTLYSEQDRTGLESSYSTSGGLLSIISGRTSFSYWYGNQAETFLGSAESSYFPGYILLVMGLSGLAIAGWKIFLTKKSLSIERGDLLLAGYACLILISCIVLSYGPFLRTATRIPEQPIKLPFYYLAQFIPGLDSVRAPGRFGIFIGLPLSMLTLYAIRELKISNHGHQFIIAGLLIGLIVECLPAYKVFDFTPDPDGIYARLGKIVEEGTPLLEVPIFAKDHIGTIGRVNDQLVGSTYYWARIPVGYGAKYPSQYFEFLDIDHKISTTSPKYIEDMLQYARRNRIKFGLIHQKGYPTEVFQHWLSSCKNWTKADITKINTFLLNFARQTCLDLSPPSY